MQIEWMGNATVHVQTEKARFTFDPFFTRNPAIASMSMDDLTDTNYFLITHGHFDHVADLPRIFEKKTAPTYAPVKVLKNLVTKMGAHASLLLPASQGNEIAVDDATLRAYDAKHVSFDWPLIRQTIGQILNSDLFANWPLLRRNLADHSQFPMGHCLAWEIESGGKKLLHLGSLAIDPEVSYPNGVDLLSLPFQGNSRCDLLSLEIVRKLKPKAVYLHHFDDAFPPISSHVSTDSFVQMMKEEFPDIPVRIPDYRKPIEF